MAGTSSSSPAVSRSSSSSSLPSLNKSPSPKKCSPKKSPPKKLSPKQISEKLKKIQRLRRSCFKKQQCSYILKRGPKKGERCEKLCDVNKTFCRVHVKDEIKIVSSEKTTLYQRIRINRLKLNHKYVFEKKISYKDVVLSCCGEKYLLKLPVNLRIPNIINSSQYLLRKSRSAKIEWSM